MQGKIISISGIMLITAIGITTDFAYSQEMSHATFQETAQIIIDKSISQNVTASIILQSTSIQEIRIPAELEREVRENGQIKAVIFTNQDQCVLGVVDESCIMINVSRNPEDRGIIAIQDSTKEIAESYIDRINQALDTNAEFHSVFIHTDDKSNQALGTSGIISGKGMISAAYTLPMEDTGPMYEKISSVLLPKIIRDSGGFYDIAKKLSHDENAKMTFSWIPIDGKSLLQLKLSTDYPNRAASLTDVNPLEFLQVGNIKRSDYFDGGFYPLNSIIHVVVLSSDTTNFSNVNGDIVPTQNIENQEIPTDITKEGWVFDPQEGQRIQGKYIFGEESGIDENKLKFSLGGDNIQPITQELDESTIVAIIITIVAIAAAIFYLKGYKK